MSKKSECHIVKNDKTFFYFRRDENQFFIKQKAGEREGLVGFFLLRRVKEELTGKHRQVISNQHRKKKNYKKGI